MSSAIGYCERGKKEKDEIIREMQCDAKVIEDKLDKLEKGLTRAVL